VARNVYVDPPDSLRAGVYQPFGRAAHGPDYGVAPSAKPYVPMRPFRPMRVVRIPANYGQDGPPQNDSLHKLRSIWFENGPLTAPAYNVAQPAPIYRLKVLNAESVARMSVVGNNPPAQSPVSYAQGPTANLYASGK
jgi:hypothetical protein